MPEEIKQIKLLQSQVQLLIFKKLELQNTVNMVASELGIPQEKRKEWYLSEDGTCFEKVNQEKK